MGARPAAQGSHDSFIWRAPLPSSLEESTQIDVGAWGYENRFIYELERVGWTVGNPCLSIRSSVRKKCTLRVRGTRSRSGGARATQPDAGTTSTCPGSKPQAPARARG